MMSSAKDGILINFIKVLKKESELPVRPPSRGGSVWATTGNGRLPLVSDVTGPAKRRNPPPPGDLIPGSSQASVRN